MTLKGKLFNKYTIDSAKGPKKYILQIRKQDGCEYSKEVSRSTFLKKKIGDTFLYYAEYIS